ncbi:hypothetical protein GLYMA_08G225950v4 [Glycine max]|nr:hypothetical protein GLYMA_08G225950v4 [Glycine max]KAH1052584.1 hypothetical protein GYH30_022080 [Glycine max]
MQRCLCYFFSTNLKELCFFFFLFLDRFLVSRSEKEKESRCRCRRCCRCYGGFTEWVVGGFPGTSQWFCRWLHSLLPLW